jgi:hypothetical protein
MDINMLAPQALGAVVGIAVAAGELPAVFAVKIFDVSLEAFCW